jgi:hypothetical protein
MFDLNRLRKILVEISISEESYTVRCLGFLIAYEASSKQSAYTRSMHLVDCRQVYRRKVK